MAYKPAICHIATAFGLSFLKHSVCIVIARLFGSRVLLHPHCSFYFLYERQSRLVQWFVRRVTCLCHGVVVISHEWKRLQEVVPACQIYYLPNAIDLPSYRNVGQKKILSKTIKSRLHILYLGHLGKEKGSFDLISAAKIVLEQGHEVVFELVGQEQVVGDIERLNTQIANAGLEQFIHIQPAVPYKKKIELLRSADIFVYPSYHEGLPMAVMEAMACGLPIVATQVGGLPDLVCPGINGILVPAGQPSQLANAILQLLGDPQMRRSMQIKSFQLAQEYFDVEKLVPRLLDIYQASLSMRPNTPVQC